MVRRATLERDQPLAADDEDLPGAPVLPGRPSRPGRPGRADRADRYPGGQRPARRTRGAGGRWLVWLLRGVAWAVLLLIGYRGVAAIVTGQTNTPAGTRGPAVASASAFPATMAEAYVLQFGSIYLDYSPATAPQRKHELAAFLPPGTDPQLGWNGAGSARLQSEQVASIRVQNAHQAVITLLARVNSRLLELGVPVYSSAAGLVVSGEPALLPPPARVSPPQSSAVATDPVTQAALLTQLPAFFQAYADGNKVTLDRFLAPGAKVTGLDGAVTFSSVSQVIVPSGGPTRRITVTVVWRVPSAQPGSSVAAAPAGLEMTYQMTVVRRTGSWYVESIGTSTQLPGPP